MKKTILGALLFLLIACGHQDPAQPPTINAQQEVGIDPTFAWTAPTTYCDGSAITGALTYNVYASTTPIPTVSSITVPCGMTLLVDRTKISPLNTAPISALTYHTNLTQGSYTAVVTAVDAASGMEGGPSNAASFTVVLRPSAPGAPNVALCFNNDQNCK